MIVRGPFGTNCLLGDILKVASCANALDTVPL